MQTSVPSYKRHRYPSEIIDHCVWLYFRFTLSFRDIVELMLRRGVVVSYETIRRWCKKFGQAYANRLRWRRPQPGDKWHLDEAFVKIDGRQCYLWRAVDQHGTVLDILMQSRRNAKAAKKFFRKLLKGLRYVPRVLVTDGLASYEIAHRETMPSVEHRRSKYLNNRAENSHQPTRIAGAGDETVQIARARAAVSCRVQHDLPALSTETAQAVRRQVPTGDGRPFRGLARSHRDRAPRRGLNGVRRQHVPS